MESLTSRERVRRTLAHQAPDQVPIDIGSTACWFTDISYQRMKKHLGLESEGDLFRLGENAAHYDERLLDLLDTDFRHVYVQPSQKEWDRWNASNQEQFLDEWGIERHLIPSGYGGANWERMTYPLQGASIEDLDSFDWPDPYDSSRVEGLAERAKYLWEETDYAIAARAVSHGLLEIASELRGMEQFMIDMLTDKPFAHKLLRKILDFQLGLYSQFLDAVGTYVQVVQTADDYGTQNGPMISPRHFRELILPYRTELNQLIREKAPQAKIQHHTCGSVYRLLPDLIETGVDILNPVQPLAADMDPARLKAEFGDALVFHGAIDIQQALNGTVEDVRSEVKRRVEALSPNGGYILAACSNFQPDTPPENVLVMIDAAREFGRIREDAASI